MKKDNSLLFTTDEIEEIGTTLSYPVGADFDTIQTLAVDEFGIRNFAESTLSPCESSLDANDVLNPGQTTRSQVKWRFMDRSRNKMRMVVFAFSLDDAPVARQNTVCQEIEDLLNKGIDLEPIVKKHMDNSPHARVLDLIVLTPTPYVLNKGYKAQLVPEQSEWLVDGIYPQAMFYEWRTDFNDSQILENVMRAMSFDDIMYSETGSFYPFEHLDILKGIQIENPFSIYDFDVFRRHECAWRDDLRVIRNEILVFVHAGLSGKDPSRELKRFREAGCEHFLDYPYLNK